MGNKKKSNYCWIIGSSFHTGKLVPGRYSKAAARREGLKIYETYEDCLSAITQPTKNQ